MEKTVFYSIRSVSYVFGGILLLDHISDAGRRGVLYLASKKNTYNGGYKTSYIRISFREAPRNILEPRLLLMLMLPFGKYQRDSDSNNH